MTRALYFPQLACLFGLALLASCAAAGSRPEPKPELRPIPSRLHDTRDGFYLQPAGLADDYPEESATTQKIREDLEIVRDTGAKFLRFGIAWDGIETEPDQYRWGFWDELIRLAPEYGVTLLPYVCYTPRWLNPDPNDFWRKPPTDLKRFGMFMYRIASRYAGQVRSWELWNEPDLDNYWLGTPSQFTDMIVDAIHQVRRADPSAKIVLGGMARGMGPFVEEVLNNQELASGIDVVSMHGYLETWGEERLEDYPSQILKMKKLVDAKAPGRDLWMAEFGYSDWRYAATQASQWGVDVIYDYEHTPAYQAVALWKSHILVAVSQAVSLTTWYRIHDLPPNETVIGDDNNRHLGILDLAGQPKPAYFAFRFFNHLLNFPYRLADEELTVTHPQNSQSVVHAFRESDGRVIVTGWLRSSLRNEVPDHSGMAKDRRKEVVSFRLPSQSPTIWRFYKISGDPDKEITVPAGEEIKGITLTGDTAVIAEVAPTAP